jgi:hypothetical protein
MYAYLGDGLWMENRRKTGEHSLTNAKGIYLGKTVRDAFSSPIRNSRPAEGLDLPS